MTEVLSQSLSLLSIGSPLPRPRHHRALLADRLTPEDGNGKGIAKLPVHHAVPVPIPGPGSVLVRTSHVALNAYDWQSSPPSPGSAAEKRVLGRDGVGRVVAVGSGVSRLKLGDRVWFCSNASVSGSGAFQDYSVHNSSEVGLVPENLTDEQGAALGSGLLTAGVAFFGTFKMPFDRISAFASASASAGPAPSPNSVPSPPWLLVWGGAGITGVYMVQLARLLGFRVICAASPRNHAYVRSLGADIVLDRGLPGDVLVDMIRQVTDDDVRFAIDNVGSETASLCLQVLRGSTKWQTAHSIPSEGEEGNRDEDGTEVLSAKLVPIAGYPKPLSDADSLDAVRPVETLRISFSTVFYGHPDFSHTLLDLFDSLLRKDLLKPARVRLLDGGYEGIVRGLVDLRDGLSPGGYKLVARILDNKVSA